MDRPSGVTSRWSIAALACGLAGCLGIPAILAVIFGILAIRQIRRSDGAVRGMGQAIAGIVLGTVLGILLPVGISAVNSAMESARRTGCACSLNQAYKAIKLYSAAYKGKWPTVYGGPNEEASASKETWGGPEGIGDEASEWRILDRGTVEGRKLEDRGSPFKCNLSCLWLLVREGKTTPYIFTCPSDDGAYISLSATKTSWWSFESVLCCSYSYQNQLGWTATDGIDGKVVVMADRCPHRVDVVARGRAKLGAKWEGEWFKQNSPNHKGEGQNVLYGDGRVVFMNSPECGYAGNNIWVMERWSAQDGKWVPTGTRYERYNEGIDDPRDSWLVP